MFKRTISQGLFTLLLVTFGVSTNADEFNMPAGQTSLQFVPVGDVGNASRPGPYEPFLKPSLGGVNYAYDIGKYDVTSAQYTAFLNAVAKSDPYGLWSDAMADPVGRFGCNIQRTGISGDYTYSVAADWANRPVNYVGYWSSCRFVNWLENGQPVGAEGSSTTEDGTYTLNGYTGSDGSLIQRNSGSEYALPTGDEWFKAAYYKGGGTDAGYWTFPTQSDTIPTAELPPGGTIPPGSAMYDGDPGLLDPTYHMTEVGAYINSPGTYGTYDMAGEISAWSEDVSTESGSIATDLATFGGNWNSGGGNIGIDVPTTGVEPPDEPTYWLGFRIVSLPVSGSRLLGDANGDGKVDSLDLAIVENYLGQSVLGGYSMGDFNGDGVINSDDVALFTLGLAEYNKSIGNPLPEPVCLPMTGLASLILIRRTQRGRNFNHARCR